MAQVLVKNFAYSTLQFGVTNSQTSITVATGHGARFPSPTGGDWFYVVIEDASLNREIVKCTARSSDILTVVRAQEGTAAIAFSAASVTLRITAQTFSDAQGGMYRTSATGSLNTPAGTTAQRDGSPVDGYTRFNTTLTQLEAYFSAGWNRVLTALDPVGFLNVAQQWTACQRTTPLTDNDLSFDLAAANDFVCTPAADGTLTFTNITAGCKGEILLVNNSNYTIAKAATVKSTATFLTTISATGRYRIAYSSLDGTNVDVTASGALS